ncbi:hypothetical protein FOTG_16994 [Fusarium oxysporum f. sp. vasinfectum 25433]|uniref:Uncharacterized protein n=1 Tax=Fusarium oxysporum f. sp. vasinfectum 25433 TaxID=1089449 RepID=X0M1Q8_FUSOX|nr:hypothetical protein FOTG_16994 [Fusarium oxysporum f. sp. vasinfectum 25433]
MAPTTPSRPLTSGRTYTMPPEEARSLAEELQEITESLRKTAENSQKLYKEHIEHTQALIATGKDPREIL